MLLTRSHIHISFITSPLVLVDWFSKTALHIVEFYFGRSFDKITPHIEFIKNMFSQNTVHDDMKLGEGTIFGFIRPQIFMRA
jgi:hypothetical protein